MLTFIQLTEALDKPFDWRWLHRGSGTWMAAFETGEHTYTVYMAPQRGQGEWSFNFADEDVNIALTGSGQAFRVMSTVLAILKAFIEVANPSVIRFSGDKSHAKIYMAMLKRYSKASDFRGYEWKQEPFGALIGFSLIRKDAV